MMWQNYKKMNYRWFKNLLKQRMRCFYSCAMKIKLIRKSESYTETDICVCSRKRKGN